eukprot:scaffold11756_cov24-Phaeocystis_antarctica.AAC.1
MSRCLSRTELSGLRVVCTVPRLQVRPLASNNEDPDRCAGARVVLKEPGACGVVGRARANRSVLSTGCKLDPTRFPAYGFALWFRIMKAKSLKVGQPDATGENTPASFGKWALFVRTH